jgi:hypothetical protein
MIGDEMNNITQVSKEVKIEVINTNIFENLDIDQKQTSLFAGPFLPVLSGNYDLYVVKTSDFKTVSFPLK